MRRRLLALAAAAALALSPLTATAPAGASTGGTRDDTANRYSNVGLLLTYTDGLAYRCTGTLVSPTVVLTAAHCTFGVDGTTLVDFRPLVAEQSPSGYPTAADEAAGFTSDEIEAAGFRAGTARTHPAYSDFTDKKNWNDVGVIVLDRPATGVAISPLADVGTLDRLGRDTLAKTLFRGVGYGTEVRKPETGPQKPTPMSYPLVRRYVDMPGQKLTSQILQTNGNPNDPRGSGGSCFGDSGGPLLLDGAIVALTSYGNTDNCRYVVGNQRVDAGPARTWVDSFLG